MPARLVLLASGSGSTLQAILDDPELGPQVVAAGTDVASCRAMERAVAARIPTFAVPMAPDRSAWNESLAVAIADHAPDLVVLAGFMRVLGPQVVGKFAIVNTHPSLLPAFPGAHAVRDALAHGVKVTGVTVHRVDEGLDSGPILAQVAVPVLDGDDEDTLRARVQAAEKPLYIETIRKLCQELSE